MSQEKGNGKISRRSFLRGAVAAAGLPILAACAPATPEVVEKTIRETVEVEVEVPVEVEKTVIVEKEVEVEVVSTAAPIERAFIDLWWGWPGWTGVLAMDAIIDGFNKSQQQIVATGLAVSGMRDKMLPAIAAGTPPDSAVGNLPYYYMQAKGGFEPLDDLVNVSEVIAADDFLASAWGSGIWQGVRYRVPAIINGPVWALCYNVGLVEGAGLDADNPPETWDELYDWHVAITSFDAVGNVEILGFDPKDTEGTYSFVQDGFVLGASWGLDWYDTNTHETNLDNEEMVEAFATVKQFYDYVGVEKMEGYRTSYGTWTESPTASLPAGVQAMNINGFWAPGELAKSSPDNTFRYTWTPMPESRRGIKIQNLSDHSAGLPKGSPNPEAGFKMVEFLTTGEANDIVFEATGWFGARISWLETMDKFKYEGLDFYIDSINLADEFHPNPGMPIASFGLQIFNDLITKVNYGDITPAEAATELQETLTSELQSQFPELY